MKSIFYLALALGILVAIFGDDDDPISNRSERTTVIRTAPSQTQTQATAQPAAYQPNSQRTETTTSQSSPQPVRFVYVTGSSVNIRTSPSSQGQRLGSLPYGTKLHLLDTKGNWSLVSKQTNNGLLKGWMYAKYLSASATQTSQTTKKKPPKRTIAAPSGAEITRAKNAIIQQSIASYQGSCPCPYNRDRAGRRCGKRSAWSRPGGRSPICYESDVTAARLESYFARRR